MFGYYIISWTYFGKFRVERILESALAWNVTCLDVLGLAMFVARDKSTLVACVVDAVSGDDKWLGWEKNNKME